MLPAYELLIPLYWESVEYRNKQDPKITSDRGGELFYVGTKLKGERQRMAHDQIKIGTDKAKQIKSGLYSAQDAVHCVTPTLYASVFIAITRSNNVKCACKSSLDFYYNAVTESL